MSKKKSHYSDILTILGDLFEAEEPPLEEEIIKKHGEKKYKIFSKHCITRDNPYVNWTGDEKNKHLELTQAGLKFYLELKRNDEEKIMSRLNFKASIGAVSLTLAILILGSMPKELSLFFFISWSAYAAVFITALFFIITAITEYVNLQRSK